MKPFVSIVVTSFLPESKRYLDLCIKSIENLDYPKDRYEVIIVSPPGYEPLYEGTRVVHPVKENYYNAHALNYGASVSALDTSYYFFLNDDVILTRFCLSNLVEASRAIGDRGLFMPIGNDQQAKYMLPVYIQPGPYRYDDIKDHATALMNATSPFYHGMFFYETLCLYAELVPKAVFEAVGAFDDSRQGQDDIDYCLRVRRQGFVNAIVLNSLCYHAGGVTADITMTDGSRAASLKSFEEKWGERPRWVNV